MPLPSGTIASPGWVQFDIDFKDSPSRCSTGKRYQGRRQPSAHARSRASHRHRVQRCEVLLGVHFDIQVTGWAAAWPASPWSAMRMRMPSPIPAGILTVMSALLHAAIATTVVTRIGDDLTKALALRTRT